MNFTANTTEARKTTVPDAPRYEIIISYKKILSSFRIFQA